MRLMIGGSLSVRHMDPKSITKYKEVYIMQGYPVRSILHVCSQDR